MKEKTTISRPAAYSYIRFSSLSQASGDTLRRQQENRDAWLAKTGAFLDQSLTLRDMGVSAFKGAHRENPDRHALALFLRAVEEGKVPRGSYLLVESLDRLTREHIRPALTLLLNLIEAGVRIVQLLPVEAVYDDTVEPMALMQAIMELSRGHSESRMKSERLGSAWKEKKRLAAKDKTPLTSRVPSWLRVEGGRFVVDPEKAATIKGIYRMAADGLGLGAIAKRLNSKKDGVPPIGRGKHWARSYVNRLLTTRAVLGEYQPHTRRGGVQRVADGDVVKDYFPAIITEDEYHAASAAMSGRRLRGGRPAARVNLFTGLLRDARSGGGIHRLDKGKKGCASLVPYMANNGVPGGGKCISFPLDIFETSILSKLREIAPRDILPGRDASGDKVAVLTGKKAEVETRIAKIKTQLVEGDFPSSIVDVLGTLDEKLVTLTDELGQARREAATPLSEAWQDCHGILDALMSAKDKEDARLKLRSAMRRMMDGVWCLFLARGSWRIAAVQIWFTGGSNRSYLILHRQKQSNGAAIRKPITHVRSPEDLMPASAADLRKPAHARDMEQALSVMDLESLK